MGLAKKNALVKKKGRATFSKAKEFKAKAKSKQRPLKGALAKKVTQIKKKKEDLPISYKVQAIKMTGLPFDVTDKEIRKWFKESGAPLNELQRCDSEKWKSGMAYGTVLSDEVLQKALQQDKKELKGRNIQVTMKPKVEMKSVMRAVSVLDCFAILRGLPFDCKKAEIAEFFKGLSIAENGICFENRGNAFVRFVDPATAKEALERNNNYIRNRYVRVVFCKLQNLTELKWHLSRQSGPGGKAVMDGLFKPLQMQNDHAKSKSSELKVKKPKKKSKKEPQLEAEIEEAKEEMMADSDEASDEGDQLSSGEEDSGDESMEEAEENLEATTTAIAAAKKKKSSMKSSGRSSYLASKGFAVGKTNGSFTEIVKKNSSARKSGGKRTPKAMKSGKEMDSDEEMVPQLIPVSPKQMRMSTSPKKSRITPMKKKGKRRSMFTVTPK